MADSSRRKPPYENVSHTARRQVVAMAVPAQHRLPQADHCHAESAQRPVVAGRLTISTVANSWPACCGTASRRITPKHGSWLNRAEIEVNLLSRECLIQRRIGDLPELYSEVHAWELRINRDRITIDWKFTRK